MTPRDFTTWLSGYLDGAEVPDKAVIQKKLGAVTMFDPVPVVPTPQISPYPIYPASPVWTADRARTRKPAGPDISWISGDPPGSWQTGGVVPLSA